MPVRFPVIIFFVLLLSVKTYGQPYYSKRYSVKNGLPSNAIRAILKDKNGYLWIGTDAGVSKFDGKEFINYTTSEGLTGNYVWSIEEANDGTLYFGCYDNGVSIYKNNRFFSLPEKYLTDKHIRKVHFSERFNCLLIGTDKGLSVIDKDTVIKFEEKDYPGKSGKMQVMDFLETNEFIYCFTYAGRKSYKYFPGTHHLQYTNNSDKFYQKNFRVSECFQSKKGNVLLSYDREGFRDYKGKHLKTFIDIGQIFDYTEDKEGNIWMAAWSFDDMKQPGGIFKYDGKNCINFKDSLGIDEQMFFSTYYDKENEILWIGTVNKGLYMVPDFFFLNVTEFEKGTEINYFYIDDEGKNWIITNKGLFIFKNRGLIKQIPFSFFASFRKYFTRLKYSAINKPKLISIIKDNNNYVWITSTIGLFKFNIKGEYISFVKQYFDHKSKFIFDKENKLLHSTWGKFGKLNISNTQLSYYCKYYKIKTPADATSVYKDNEEIWISTKKNGLSLIRKDTVLNFNTNNSQIKTNYLSAVCEDNYKNIITSSFNDKIWIYKRIKDSLILYKTIDKSGIIGKSINWITCNNKNILFVSTNSGINTINLNEMYEKGYPEVHFFDNTEGLGGTDNKCPVIDKRGNLYFVSDNKIIKFNKPFVHQNKKHIFIKKFSISFKDTLLFGIKEKNQVKIFKHNENTLEFHFDVLNFLNPEKDLFRYRLSGFQNNFTEFNDKRTASFMNLPPGMYTFELQSKNLNTGQAEDIFTLNFKILKPWWKTSLFYVLSAVFLIAFIWLIFTLRFRRLNKEKRLQIEINKKIAETEMKALQSQMNPHFVFNAITSIQNYVLGNDIDNANKYLGYFSNLLRQTLNNASEKFITLKEEINYLEHYIKLEKLRFGNAFSTEIKIDDKIDTGAVLIPPMLLQPLIENSIKHGLVHKVENGKITLEFSQENKLLICSVSDNGIGRAAASRKNVSKIHKSKGLQIVKDRIHLLNGPNTTYRLEIRDLNPDEKKGTKVTLYLPYKIF